MVASLSSRSSRVPVLYLRHDVPPLTRPSVLVSTPVGGLSSPRGRTHWIVNELLLTLKCTTFRSSNLAPYSRRPWPYTWMTGKRYKLLVSLDRQIPSFLYSRLIPRTWIEHSSPLGDFSENNNKDEEIKKSGCRLILFKVCMFFQILKNVTCGFKGRASGH